MSHAVACPSSPVNYHPFVRKTHVFLLQSPIQPDSQTSLRALAPASASPRLAGIGFVPKAALAADATVLMADRRDSHASAEPAEPVTPVAVPRTWSCRGVSFLD